MDVDDLGGLTGDEFVRRAFGRVSVEPSEPRLRYCKPDLAHGDRLCCRYVFHLSSACYIPVDTPSELDYTAHYRAAQSPQQG